MSKQRIYGAAFLIVGKPPFWILFLMMLEKIPNLLVYLFDVPF